MVRTHALVDKKGMLDEFHLRCSPPLEIEMTARVATGEQIIWSIPIAAAAAAGSDDVVTSIGNISEIIAFGGSQTCSSFAPNTTRSRFY
jgi:hypothetical protein